MSEKRVCKATTRAGKPCKASPLTDSDFCLAHSDAKIRESTGFVADNGKQGRPKLPTPSEVARKLIEENIAIILRPHFRALGYDVETGGEGVVLVPLEGGGAKLYGESRDGVVRASAYDDLGAQIAAADKLLDRIYGKARQSTELVGAQGGPVEVVPVRRDKAAQVAGILDRVGAGEDG